MFNRNNPPYPSRPNPGPDPRRPGYDPAMGDPNRGAYGAPPLSHRGPPPPQQSARRPVNDASGRAWSLRSEKSPNNAYTYGNIVAVSPADFPPQNFGHEFYLLINDLYVMSARPLDGFPQGFAGFGGQQRMWARIAVTDSVKAQIYNPFNQERKAYLGSTDVEIGFAGKSRTEEPYDQNELGNSVIEVS